MFYPTELRARSSQSSGPDSPAPRPDDQRDAHLHEVELLVEEIRSTILDIEGHIQRALKSNLEAAPAAADKSRARLADVGVDGSDVRTHIRHTKQAVKKDSHSGV